MYSKESADSFILPDIPADCGTVEYSEPTVEGDLDFKEAPKVSETGELSYTLNSGTNGTTGSITVTAKMQNYKDIKYTVSIYQVLLKTIKLKPGTDVALKKDTLTYGQKLSELEFKQVSFVSDDEDALPISGEIKWKEPNSVLDAGTTSAEWVFKPSDPSYSEYTGNVAITVNKASGAMLAIYQKPTVIEELVCTGKAQALVTAPLSRPMGYTGVVYALGEDDENEPDESAYSDSIPTGISAKTYYVWYKVVGDGNHYDYEADSLMVTIAMSKDVPNKPEQTMTVDYSVKKAEDIKLPEGWVVSEEDRSRDLLVGENVITVVYAGVAQESFKNISEDIIVTRAICEHPYGEAVYTWSDDGKSCSAKAVCKNDDTHVITETATVTGALKTPATETANGVTTYTATFKNEVFKTQTKDVADIPAIQIEPEPLKDDTKGTEPANDDTKTPEPAKDDTKASEPAKEETNAKAEGTTITTTDKNAEYVVVKGEDNTPSVKYKLTSKSKEKKVVVTESVTVDGVTYKVTEVADKAFKGNKSVETIVLPASVTVIGKDAFAGCTNLKSVTIPASVTEIGANAVKDCTKLTKIDTGKNVKKIGSRAFKGCKLLQYVYIGGKTDEIGDEAFANCTLLTTITIPAKVKKLGSNIFKGCKKLKTIIVKTKKLKDKTVAKKAFKGVGKKVVVKVPSKYKKTYTKLFRKKGLSKKVKIK